MSSELFQYLRSVAIAESMLTGLFLGIEVAELF